MFDVIIKRDDYISMQHKATRSLLIMVAVRIININMRDVSHALV
jgi:hypothetical protein